MDISILTLLIKYDFFTDASILSIVDVIDDIYLGRYSRSSVSIDRPLLLLDISVLSIGRSLISIYISASID